MDRREFVLRGMGAVTGLGAVAGGLAACSSDSGTGPDGNGGGGGGGGGGGNGGGGGMDDNTVEVDDNLFRPAELTVTVGTTVTWTHVGNNFHTITPEGHEEWVRQSFPAGASSFQHTFNTVGTFPYICEPHESFGMVGTVVVQASS